MILHSYQLVMSYRINIYKIIEWNYALRVIISFKFHCILYDVAFLKTMLWNSLWDWYKKHGKHKDHSTEVLLPSSQFGCSKTSDFWTVTFLVGCHICQDIPKILIQNHSHTIKSPLPSKIYGLYQIIYKKLLKHIFLQILDTLLGSWCAVVEYNVAVDGMFWMSSEKFMPMDQGWWKGVNK